MLNPLFLRQVKEAVLVLHLKEVYRNKRPTIQTSKQKMKKKIIT
ncbi:hypothetical protein RV14_GL002158 [Enterococcus ratti]|uniref:Uncharacterized protein n=1 Tax=Enterococcus ratti TaxID=150033 RepID=A0A1L8WPF7_9ENTE|nr:hypothetical protein RV14_GL002158 [Enterococcus ratti]